MPSSPPEPSGRSRDGSLRKRLLGCGCAAALLLLLSVVGLWIALARSVTRDPAQVAALGRTIVPGATMPEGYAGVLAMDGFGYVKAALFSTGPVAQDEPPKQTVIALMWRHTTDAEATRREAVIETGSAPEGVTREELEPETVQVAGQALQMHKARLTGDGPPQLQMHVFLLRPDHIVVVMCSGPEASFDRAALDAYLASIPAPAK